MKFYSKHGSLYSYIMIDMDNRQFRTFWLNYCIDWIELKYNSIYNIKEELEKNWFSEGWKLDFLYTDLPQPWKQQ